MDTTTPSTDDYQYEYSDSLAANATNNRTSFDYEEEQNLPWDDVTWIITSAFLIFTMQSGYGLIESGIVSLKNEVNILLKNGANLALGGLTYWAFGYALSFGTNPASNPFFHVGNMGEFFINPTDNDEMGHVYSRYVFQLAYSTTATTLVSGAMAERCKFSAYCIFSMMNTLVYVIPAGWIWGPKGFLNTMGAVDLGGAGTVHLCGSVAGLVGAWMLGPRIGRYDHGTDPLPMGNPTNALMGLFMLWWGWLGFNAGSTYGIAGNKWSLASRASVTTIMSSMGGGIVAMITSFVTRHGCYDVADMVNGVLSALVSISACSPLVRPIEAVSIGAIGAVLTLFGVPILDKIGIDDPCDAVSVHGIAGAWGMIVVGLIPSTDNLVGFTKGRAGLIKSGDFTLLGVQTLATVCIILWSASCSFVLLFAIDKTIGLRSSPQDEIVGPDYSDHDIIHHGNEDLVLWHQKVSDELRERRAKRRKDSTMSRLSSAFGEKKHTKISTTVGSAAFFRQAWVTKAHHDD